MGGAIAGLYAAKYPRDVAALVLVDSAGVPFKENAFVRELASGKSPFDIDDRAQFRHLSSLLFAHPPSVPGRIQDVFVDKSKGDGGHIVIWSNEKDAANMDWKFD